MYTYNQVKEIYNSKNMELISAEYLGADKFLIYKDKEGYYYYNILSSFLRNKNNSTSRFHKSNPYTIQNIKLWCKLNNKSFKLLSNEYKGSKINLKWQCLKDSCREIFEISWSCILRGQGCSYCAGKQVGLSNCLATRYPELAKEWHPTKNGNLTPYDITCGSDQDIWWQCSENPKHEWKVSILNRVFNKCNCPFCSGRYADEENNLFKNNPKLCEEWDYNKNDKKPEDYTPYSHSMIWWKCKKCGYEWKASILDRNYNHGCPKCNKSKGEKRSIEWFNNNDFIEITQKEYNKMDYLNKINNKYYISQKKFKGLVGVGNGLLSYDFYLPNYNLLIEYQGEQHERYYKGFHKSKKDFLKQQEHDLRKREYAQNNNIKLLEIWYKDYNNIEEILDKKLIYRN